MNDKDLKDLETVFSMARLQQVTSRPDDENGLAFLINFKIKVFEALKKTKEEPKKDVQENS